MEASTREDPEEVDFVEKYSYSVLS
jgi:hypothetical protein